MSSRGQGKLCGEKEAYPRLEAMVTAMRRGHRAYKCSVCRKWHTTNQLADNWLPEALPNHNGSGSADSTAAKPLTNKEN